MRFSESLDIQGHLQIYKVYEDNTQELVFDDHNLITSGMGFTIASMMSVSGVNLSNYQITRFQVGVSGDENATSAINDLSSPLSVGEWGANTALDIDTHDVWLNGSTATRDFGVISPALIQKLNRTTIRFVLVLDENTANGETLNEVGLFSYNPLELSTPASVMVAYRKFDNIQKTANFTLQFLWSIRF